MATVATDDPQQDEDSQPQESSPARKSFLSSKKIKILALLVLVMGVEAAMFLILVPQQSGGSDGGEVREDVDLEEIESVEVSLGKIHVSNSRATPGVTISLQFSLLVDVSQDQESAFDQVANKQRKGLVKGTVEMVVGSASLEDLNDPAHRLISRRIKEEINKALKKSYVIRVHINGWQKMEL